MKGGCAATSRKNGASPMSGLTRARAGAGYVSVCLPTAASMANGRVCDPLTLCRRIAGRSMLPNPSPSPVLTPAPRLAGIWRGRLGQRARPAAGRRRWTARRRPLLDRESGPVPRRGAEVRGVGGFSIGDRVFHQKFGYGMITAVEDNKLAIRFEHAGDKKVLDAYVEHTLTETRGASA